MRKEGVYPFIEGPINSDNPEIVFQYIFESGFWGDDCASGPGSTAKETSKVVGILRSQIDEKRIKTCVDLGCGTGSWQKELGTSLEIYLGLDIVPALIEQAIRDAPANFFYKHANIAEFDIPKADLYVARDVFGHLDDITITEILEKLKIKGGFLAATTFPSERSWQHSFRMGGWRPLNLQDAKYALGQPACIQQEGYSRDIEFSDKALAVWELNV